MGESITTCIDHFSQHGDIFNDKTIKWYKSHIKAVNHNILIVGNKILLIYLIKTYITDDNRACHGNRNKTGLTTVHNTKYDKR